MITQVSAVGCNHCGRRSFLIPIGLQGRRTHRGSVEERSEQLGRNIPDPHSAAPGRGSTAPDLREDEDRGPGVQGHSETAPERTLGDSQDDGGADDLIRSGKSRGKSWCSDCATTQTDLY